MQALGCQSVSDSVSLKSAVRRAALPVAAVLMAAVLSACAPMPHNAEGAVATTGHTAADNRVGAGQGSELLVKSAPGPAHKAIDPAQARQERLEEMEAPEVDQQGLASWYGPGFHGRKTANGERYNQYELTAAHPKYAFDTQLCVRNAGNGKTVVVRVNDRGPFVGKRVIDLSKAAAEEIGMLSKGIKRVEIYKLDEGQEECPEALLQAQG